MVALLVGLLLDGAPPSGSADASRTLRNRKVVQTPVQAPRARLGGVAPEFALRDLSGRRRRSEDVFGSMATALVFLDGSNVDAEASIGVLAQLEQRLPCDAFRIVVVDLAPGWARPARLSPLYRSLRRTLVLRDPDRELEPAYLLQSPPLAFLLDRRQEVRFIGSPEALAQHRDLDRLEATCRSGRSSSGRLLTRVSRRTGVPGLVPMRADRLNGDQRGEDRRLRKAVEWAPWKPRDTPL